MGDWCTIESDPAVFNEMLWSLGVNSVAIEEIYSLEDLLTRSEPSFGLIFLFKWKQETDARPIADEESTQGLIFARQIVTNACATQALLSVVLNTPDLPLGETLTEFKGFMSILDPESRGMAIENSDALRTVHNSFARPEPFLTEDDKTDDKDKGDAHHFIAFVPHFGQVYELDGLKEGPISVGTIDGSGNWQTVAYEALRSRTDRFSASETHFALLSVAPRRKLVLQQQIDAFIAAGVAPDSEGEMAELTAQLRAEEEKEERQRQENIRRRHNFVPFAVQLLRELAKRGELQGVIEGARERAREAALRASEGK